jgi:predicted enzyme related to lactoylglutathione lyase
MLRPIHFDLTVDNPDRAMTFYRDIFGWKFEKWNGPMEYWMVTTGDEKEQELMAAFPREATQVCPT